MQPPADPRLQDGDRISEFELKLMDIDSEHLGIPETEYKCIVKMPANEFQRIVRDLAVLGDTVTIGVSKEGVKFHVKGDLGTGNILRKSSKSGDKPEQWTTVEMEESTEVRVRACARSCAYACLRVRACSLRVCSVPPL